MNNGKRDSVFKNYFLKFSIILIVSFIALSQGVSALEKGRIGFVSLFDGSAKYKDRSDNRNAIGSFFLVRIFDEYNFHLGAFTFATYDTTSEDVSDSRNNGDVAAITLNSSFQHRAYGTMISYVYATEGLFAFQMWGGTGYFSNQIDLETDVYELVTDSSGNKYQCSGSSDSQSKTVYSMPFFFGIGATFNSFGFFAQTIQQTLPDIIVPHSGTVTCNRGSSSDSHTLDKEQKIALSFSSVQVGIQYRF